MTRGQGQAPLPLAWPARLGAETFVVVPGNRVAVEWLAEPGRWPMPACVLVGPAGAGKSHLAGLFAGSGGRVIEDADGRSDGEALFHAWNAATPACPLLLTARRRPRFWPHGLADLASRLAATPLVEIGDPDDELIAAILAKHLRDRGLKVAPEVVAYLVGRIERSAAAAAVVVAGLDALALAERREITVPLARELLEGQLRLAL